MTDSGTGLVVAHGGGTYGSNRGMGSNCISTQSGSSVTNYWGGYGFTNTLFNSGSGDIKVDSAGIVGNVIVGSGTLTPFVSDTATDFTIATGGAAAPTGTLTVSGDFTTSGGLIGKSALLFDGVNDYCYATSTSGSTSNPTDNLYVEAWWKSTDGTPETTSIIGKASSYMLYINGSGHLQGYVYGSSSNTSASYGVSIFDQKWHHCAIGYSRAGGLKVWLDGKLVATDATDAGTLNQNANDIRAMRYDTNYGQGTLAMGRIWTGQFQQMHSLEAICLRAKLIHLPIQAE